jgi:hypothetical protein
VLARRAGARASSRRECAKSAEALVELFREHANVHLQTRAQALVAMACLAGNDLAGATSAAALARESAKATDEFIAGFQAAIAEAKVSAASGDRDEATAILGDVQSRAETLGIERYRLEAGLELGAIELDVDAAAGRARLEAIAEEAGTEGFALIAELALRRAASPRAPSGLG